MQKTKKIPAFAACLVCILTTWLTTAAPVMASAEITLTVKNPDPYTGNQSWFVYEKKPGEQVEDIASIKNFGDEAARVRIYPVDATTSSAGSFILKFDHEEQTGIGAWAHIEPPEITVQPGQRIDIPFNIKIPADISPGQYIGGVVIEYGSTEIKNDDLSGKSSQECAEKNICASSVAVKTRIGSRIYLTVPGAVQEDVQVTDFTYGPGLFGKPYFTLTIVNRGNVAYEPRAEITIRDSAGNIIGTMNKPLGVIMANSTTRPSVVWEKSGAWFGNYSAEATVSFPKRFQAAEGLHGAAFSTIKKANFIVFPWTLFTASAMLLITGAGLYSYSTLRTRKILASSEKYTVSGNEDIVSLAESRHVDWKIIARINKLKPPYTLRAGDKIILPKKND